MKANIVASRPARSAAHPIWAALGLALTYMVLCGACFRVSIPVQDTSAEEAP